MLQSYWRRWLSCRYVSDLLRERRVRQEWERGREEERRRRREERERAEFQRRMNPTTKEDFELLYHALEGRWAWHVHTCMYMYTYSGSQETCDG